MDLKCMEKQCCSGSLDNDCIASARSNLGWKSSTLREEKGIWRVIQHKWWSEVTHKNLLVGLILVRKVQLVVFSMNFFFFWLCLISHYQQTTTTSPSSISFSNLYKTSGRTWWDRDNSATWSTLTTKGSSSILVQATCGQNWTIAQFHYLASPSLFTVLGCQHLGLWSK